MRKKYGDDYDAEERADEIFPESSVDSVETGSDGQGQSSQAGD